jgi:hypothetical protein
MDIETIDDVIYWINRQPDWGMVRSERILQALPDADIPQDAKDAISRLPQGEWTRAGLVAEVRELMLDKMT